VWRAGWGGGVWVWGDTRDGVLPTDSEAQGPSCCAGAGLLSSAPPRSAPRLHLPRTRYPRAPARAPGRRRIKTGWRAARVGWWSELGGALHDLSRKHAAPRPRPRGAPPHNGPRIFLGPQHMRAVRHTLPAYQHATRHGRGSTCTFMPASAKATLDD
jgi:hypothetical protein